MIVVPVATGHDARMRVCAHGDKQASPGCFVVEKQQHMLLPVAQHIMETAHSCSYACPWRRRRPTASPGVVCGHGHGSTPIPAGSMLDTCICVCICVLKCLRAECRRLYVGISLSPRGILQWIPRPWDPFLRSKSSPWQSQGVVLTRPP